MSVTKLSLLLAVLLQPRFSRPFQIQLSPDKLTDFGDYTFNTEPGHNRHQIHFDVSLLKDSDLWVKFETSAPAFSVVFRKDFVASQPLLEVQAPTGHFLFCLTHNLFDSLFGFVRETRSFATEVLLNDDSRTPDVHYRLVFTVTQKPTVAFGPKYHLVMDPWKSTADIEFFGQCSADTRKLRFQVEALTKRFDFRLSAKLWFDGRAVPLNNIFTTVVGGVLMEPEQRLCVGGVVSARISLFASKAKLLAIEGVQAKAIEVLSPLDKSGYFGRTTAANSTVLYEVPFHPSLNTLDLSLLLMPVVGTTELYVNTRTIPLTLDSYDWKNTSPISKRMTIRRKDLALMNAQEDSVFVAVRSNDPAEFFLKLDLHSQDIAGKLTPGVTESVSLAKDELVTFTFVWEVESSDKAVFEVRADRVEGQVGLRLVPCESMAACRVTDKTLEGKEVLSGSDSLGHSSISFSGQCKPITTPPSKAKACWFLVLAMASSNTTFELTVSEPNRARLLIPNHQVETELAQGQTAYFKLSNPYSEDQVDRIRVAVYPHYGNIEVFASKAHPYPNEELHSLSKAFSSSQAGLDQSAHFLDITNADIDDKSLTGTVYLGVKASAATAFALKFINPSVATRTVTSLPEGVEVREHLEGVGQTAYFSVDLRDQVQPGQTDQVFLHVTPIKGSFRVLANKGQAVPTARRYEWSSDDNNLQVPMLEGDTSLTVAVTSQTKDHVTDTTDLQFLIGYSRSGSVMRLQEGVFFTKFVHNNTRIAIELRSDVTDLLVLRNAMGQDKTRVRGAFAASIDVGSPSLAFDHVMHSNQTSMFFESGQLVDQCGPVLGTMSMSHCYLVLEVQGVTGQTFSLGYSFNGNPFYLTGDTCLELPVPLRGDSQLNFVSRFGPPAHRLHLQFDSHRETARVFTRLVSDDDQAATAPSAFPNLSHYDTASQQTFGSVTEALYDKLHTKVSQGAVLVSVRSTFPRSSGSFFKDSGSVSLRVVSKIREVHRSTVANERFYADQWSFFKIFVGPNVFRFRVTVSSSSAVHISARVSRGVTTNTEKSIAEKAGFQFLELAVDDTDSELRDKKSSSKHFTLAVRTNRNGVLSLFWNSLTEPDVVQLSPNDPKSILVSPQHDLYFTFHYRPSIDPTAVLANGLALKTVVFYVQSNARVTLFLSPSGTEDQTVTEKTSRWTTQVGDNGGITSLRVRQQDPGYCVNCYFVGVVRAGVEAQVTLSAQVLTGRLDPVSLSPGVTIPESLKPKESIKFSVFNNDRDILDLTVNMLEGFVRVFVGLTEAVSETEYLESHDLATDLQTMKLVVIAPFKYNVTTQHTFYVLVVNALSSQASFCITADKNSLFTPIDHGVTKIVRLAQGESKTFVYVPKQDQTVEFVFQLRQVFNPQFVAQALSLIDQYLRVIHVDQSHLLEFPVDSLEKSFKDNKVYLSFEVPRNQLSHFLIHLYNPVGSGVVGSLNLLNKGYKLLTYNERFVDSLRPDSELVYEAYGRPSKYLFVDLRLCAGDVLLDFSQVDLKNSSKQSEVKHLKDSSSFIHFVQLESNRVLLRARNKGTDRAVYQLNVFGENELESDPFRSLIQGDGGKVQIDSANSAVWLKKVQLAPDSRQQFWCRVRYTLYLTTDLRAMKYARNCGEFMLGKVLGSDFEFFKFTTEFEYKPGVDDAAVDRNDTVRIAFRGLKRGAKHFGVVIAQVDLMSADEGVLAPVRSETCYYDEFIYTAAQWAFDFEFFIGLLFSSTVCLVVLMLCKSCLFGEADYERFLKDPTLFFRSDEVQLNFSIQTVLGDYTLEGEEQERDLGGSR